MLFIVIALMVMVVAVLILPDVDLPDTAFQRNSSLQVLRALSHQVPHARANGTAFRLSFQFEDADIPPSEHRKLLPRIPTIFPSSTKLFAAKSHRTGPA
jgi:hypothetical protein